MPTVTCPSCAATGPMPPDAAPGCPLACPLCQTVFIPTPPPAAPPVDSADGLAVWVDSAAAPRPAAADPGPPTAEEAAGGPEWLREEAARFNNHVAQQFARIEQARHRMIEEQSRAEAQAVTREMEVNRRAANLAARQADLERREAEVRRSAEELTARRAELLRLTDELAAREAEVGDLEARRAGLEAEVADLGRLASELRPVVERLELRKEEAAAARAEIAAKQSALDRRMVEVGRTEVALQRRLDELDELEANLRAELEVREGELERQRVALEEEVRATRRRVGVDLPTPPPRVWVEGAQPEGAGEEMNQPD